MSDAKSAYELLRTKAAAISGLSGLVWVRGSDAVKFLDGLLSQNVTAMGAGTTAPSLLLAPNGKLRATLLLLRGDDQVGLICDAGRVDTVVADLTRFKIRVDADIKIEGRPVWDIWGPEAHSAVGRVPPVGEWEDDSKLVVQVPFRYSALPRVVVAGSRPELPTLDAGDADAVRIEVGEPVMGLDLNDNTIPQEGVDIAATVDFGKGCYLGQELVARIDSRGHVNRRLCGVTIDGRRIPDVGSEIDHDGKAVGAVSSVAWSDELAGVVALGLVRVEVDDGTSVTIAGARGSIVALPIRA